MGEKLWREGRCWQLGGRAPRSGLGVVLLDPLSERPRGFSFEIPGRGDIPREMRLLLSVWRGGYALRVVFHQCAVFSFDSPAFTLDGQFLFAHHPLPEKWLLPPSVDTGRISWGETWALDFEAAWEVSLFKISFVHPFYPGIFVSHSKPIAMAFCVKFALPFRSSLSNLLEKATREWLLGQLFLWGCSH